MKRFLLSLVAILISSLCFAQDVIVKKDGSTILSRVVKVSSSAVEYKNFENQDGPSYTISTHELQCINYENGGKDTFVSPGDSPDIVTKETVTRFSDDKELIALDKIRNKEILTPEMLQKRGKRMKIAGYTIGGTMIVTGMAALIVGLVQDQYDYNVVDPNIIHRDTNYARYSLIYGGGAFFAAGTAVGLPLILKGSSLEKKSKAQVSSTSAINYDIELGDGTRLNLGIDVLSSNFSNERTAGIGVRYNF